MVAVGSKNVLQSTYGGRTYVADVVLFHASPHSVDRGLQLLHVGVANFAGLALDMRPYAIRD